MVCKDHYEWYLRLDTEEPIKCIAGGTKAKPVISMVEQTPPFVESDTGCNRRDVSECYLFSVKLDFEKAKEYRKSYGAYLRHNQWNDIEVEVCMLI